jgi:hypothetical protein
MRVHPIPRVFEPYYESGIDMIPGPPSLAAKGSLIAVKVEKFHDMTITRKEIH